MKGLASKLFMIGIAAQLFILSLAAPAKAETQMSSDPDQIASMLLAAGYKAKLDVSDGDPEIVTASSGNDITLSFFGCTKQKACNQIELVSVWRCPDDEKKCKANIAKWNDQEMFAGAIFIENPGSVALYQHVLIGNEGVSINLLIRNVEQFSRDALEFMALF